MKLSYILGYKNTKKTSHISGSNFPSSKSEKKRLLKCFLYFGKLSFLASSLNFFFYISGGNLESLKMKNFILFVC